MGNLRNEIDAGRRLALVAAMALLVVACNRAVPERPTSIDPTSPTTTTTTTTPSLLVATATVSIGDETQAFTLEHCGVWSDVLSVDGKGDIGTLAIRHASPPTRPEAGPSLSVFDISGELEAHGGAGGMTLDEYVPQQRATGTALVEIGIGPGGDDTVQFDIVCGPETADSETTMPTWPAPTAPGREGIVASLPADRPYTFAAIFDDSVQIVEGEWWNALDIPAVDIGRFWNGQFVYSVTGVDRAWRWSPNAGREVPSPGGTELVVQQLRLVDPTLTTRLYDVATAGGEPTAIYSEIDPSTAPATERLHAYDLGIGHKRLLFDKATRRDGLTGEEQDAFIGDVAMGRESFVVLFGVGDGTWLEWYDLEGRPIDDPLPDGVPLPAGATEGAVLEVAMEGDLLAIGFESQLHRLITEVWLVDVTTGEVLSTLTHAEDGESLFDLDVDDGWLSAAVRGPDNDRVGVYLADLATDAVHIIDTDARLALNHLCC